MSATNSGGEPMATQAEQPLGDANFRHADLQQPLGYWPLDKPMPALMTATDLMQVFGIGHSWFARLKKLGRFDRFLVSPPVTNADRYSGAKVRDYVLGNGVSASGRKRA